MVKRSTQKLSSQATARCRLLQEYDIHQQVMDSIEKIKNDFENFLRERSGWALDKIQRVYVNFCKYKPLKGHAHIVLPQKLQHKSCC